MSPHSAAWGLYLHLPWCRIRCPYCPFVIRPDHDPSDRAAFVERLLARLETSRAAFPGDPHSVYLGGGTPSRLPLDLLDRLLDGLPTGQAVEVTVEANPEDVDEAFLDRVIARGVSRISLGVQTLQPDLARRLGRAHTPADARRALDLVSTRGLTSWSVDLMFGLPGQDLADLDRDLEEILSWEPPHVALYGLTIEPGTPFERADRAGRLPRADADQQADMLDQIDAALESAGLRRYEASNASRPGHEAIHNRGYWQGRPFLGLGPGAHSLAPDGTRWKEVDDLDAWSARTDPREDVETPTPHRIATDRLIGGLRAVEGVDLADIARSTGLTPRPDLVRRLVAGGLLTAHGDRVAPTRRGLAVADALTAAVVDALHPVESKAGTR